MGELLITGSVSTLASNYMMVVTHRMSNSLVMMTPDNHYFNDSRRRYILTFILITLAIFMIAANLMRKMKLKLNVPERMSLLSVMFRND